MLIKLEVVIYVKKKKKIKSLFAPKDFRLNYEFLFGKNLHSVSLFSILNWNGKKAPPSKF